MERVPGDNFSDEGRTTADHSTTITGDSSSMEAAKRRPGRPPGSKNKEKHRHKAEPIAAFSHHVLKVPSGSDVAGAITAFACHHNADIGVCVLTATGAVSSPVIRHTSPLLAAITFCGCFDIISISAAFLPGWGGSMTVVLAGPEGQVVGGMVDGPLVAAGTVVVVAATFANPALHDAINVAEGDNTSVSASLTAKGGGAVEEKRERTRSERHDEEQLRGYLDLLKVANSGDKEWEKRMLQHEEEMLQCLHFQEAEINNKSVFGSNGGGGVLLTPFGPPVPTTFGPPVPGFLFSDCR